MNRENVTIDSIPLHRIVLGSSIVAIFIFMFFYFLGVLGVGADLLELVGAVETIKAEEVGVHALLPRPYYYEGVKLFKEIGLITGGFLVYFLVSTKILFSKYLRDFDDYNKGQKLYCHIMYVIILIIYPAAIYAIYWALH